jgi:hypothetical protein
VADEQAVHYDVSVVLWSVCLYFAATAEVASRWTAVLTAHVAMQAFVVSTVLAVVFAVPLPRPIVRAIHLIILLWRYSSTMLG